MAAFIAFSAAFFSASAARFASASAFFSSLVSFLAVRVREKKRQRRACGSSSWVCARRTEELLLARVEAALADAHARLFDARALLVSHLATARERDREAERGQSCQGF
jgi:hypothetical protein